MVVPLWLVLDILADKFGIYNSVLGEIDNPQQGTCKAHRDDSVTIDYISLFVFDADGIEVHIKPFCIGADIVEQFLTLSYI
jgi:hypothetical protein